jgi:RNA polymerase sigma-70 factor (ECF subfamily)
MLVARAAELIQTDFEPNAWKPFFECAVNGRPGPEVARELGIKLATLCVYKSRVLKRLKEGLAGLLD